MNGNARCYCVSVTEQGAVFDLTYEFSRKVVALIESTDTFSVFSISPTPIAIAWADTHSLNAIHADLRRIRDASSCRIIVTAGDAFRGNVGSQQRFDFSVVGHPLALLREATMGLPDSISWLAADVAKELGLSSAEVRAIEGDEFCVW